MVAYCDRELEPKLREWVDEHVVQCKPCGIELSRIELETMRLREALVPMEPSIDFTSSVMDKVRDVVASEASVEPPASLVGKSFTSRVLDQVREDLGEDGGVDPAREKHALRPSFWRAGRARIAAFALAAAVLVAALVLPALFSEPAPAKVTAGTWFVVRAQNAGALQRGDALTLPMQGELRDGLLELENGSEGSGWKIGIEGDGRFAIVDRDRVRLEDGELLAWSTASRADRLSIDLPGGHELALDAGRYEVSVEDVEQAALMPGLDRITVRVHEGIAGFRERDGAPVQLLAGSLGILEPLQPLHIQRLPTSSMLAQLASAGGPVRGPSSTGESRRDFLLRGFVREGQAGDAVAGATVELHVGDRVVRGETLEDGSYELRADLSGVAPEDVWLAARGPADRRDLAGLAYRAFREVPGAGETRHEVLRLESARPASGRLVGADGAALADARVRALRIDSFFGGARLLAGVDVRSAQDGSFSLPAMPRERAGESTALLVESRDSSVPPHVEYLSSSRLEDGPAHVVRVAGGALVELPVQDAATRIVWVEKRPQGLAASYWRHFERIELPAAGSSTLQVRLARGAALRWWEDAGKGVPSLGHEGRPLWKAPSEVALLAGAPRELALPSVLERSKVGEKVAFAPPARLSARGFGREAPRSSSSRAEASAEATELSLHLYDGSVRLPVESARVFVRVAGGAPWFAGWTDLGGNVVVRDLPRNSAVQVVAVAGNDLRLLATARYRTDDAQESHRLAMRRARAVRGQLPAFAGSRLARIQVLDGAFAGFELCTSVGAEGQLRVEDLPPGSLRVECNERYLEVDGSAAQLPDWSGWQSRDPSTGEDR